MKLGGLAILIAAFAAVIVLASRPADPVPSQVSFGFNDNSVVEGVATPEQAAELISAAGGTVDEVQIDWASLEPQPGHRQFGLYDAIYHADLQQGVEPLFIFAFAPAWATDTPCAPTCHAAPSPAHYKDAANTAAAIAERYPRAAGIELWNEPNSPYFWAPTPDPAAYSALLAKVYSAVKHARPGMPIVAGSTSNSPGFVQGFIRAPDFVEGMKVAGAFGHMDALSLHAYPGPLDYTGDSAADAVEAVRSVMGDLAIPIWVTETGTSTSGPQAVPESAQALVDSRVSTTLARLPGVRMVLFHTLVDPPVDPESVEEGYGVVDSSLQPKPAYCALDRVWGGSSPSC